MPRWAVKVAPAIEAAIAEANRLIMLHTDPRAKAHGRHLAHELHNASIGLAIRLFDDAAVTLLVDLHLIPRIVVGSRGTPRGFGGRAARAHRRRARRHGHDHGVESQLNLGPALLLEPAT